MQPVLPSRHQAEADRFAVDRCQHPAAVSDYQCRGEARYGMARGSWNSPDRPRSRLVCCCLLLLSVESFHFYRRLLKYGDCFIRNHFESPAEDHVARRPPLTLWDRTTIWNHLPEMSYTEFMESPNGLVSWLEMFYKYGIAILRGVPVTQVINLTTTD